MWSPIKVKYVSYVYIALSRCYILLLLFSMCFLREIFHLYLTFKMSLWHTFALYICVSRCYTQHLQRKEHYSCFFYLNIAIFTFIFGLLGLIANFNLINSQSRLLWPNLKVLWNHLSNVSTDCVWTSKILPSRFVWPK